MITSKEEILTKSRELMKADGWQGLNIRAVASACGISIGSVYNYYESKAALEEATVESIWFDIFHSEDEKILEMSIISYVEWLFERMKYGDEAYPGFFSLHSVSLISVHSKNGKRLMSKSWKHMEMGLTHIIKMDKEISKDAFDDDFTPEMVAHTIFSLLISAMLQKDYDSKAIISIVKRTLY